MSGFSYFKNKSENKSVTVVTSSFLFYWGLLSLLIALVSSCDVEKINVGYTQISINNTSTNQSIIITNVDILKYNPTMASVVTEMQSEDIDTKNRGFNTFVTETTQFPWENTDTAITVSLTNYITNVTTNDANVVETNTITNVVTNTSTAISIEAGYGRDFIRQDCDTSLIVRIDNNYANTTAELYQRKELQKKYAFALIEPAVCGAVYRLNIPAK